MRKTYIAFKFEECKGVGGEFPMRLGAGVTFLEQE